MAKKIKLNIYAYVNEYGFCPADVSYLVTKSDYSNDEKMKFVTSFEIEEVPLSAFNENRIAIHEEKIREHKAAIFMHENEIKNLLALPNLTEAKND